MRLQKKEFIIGNSVSSVVGAVILFAIIFGASGFLLDTLHDAKFNEEIDEIGHHNNTVTVDEFTQFGPDFPKLTGLLEMTEENIP